jgi:acetyl esterase/lipase
VNGKRKVLVVVAVIVVPVLLVALIGQVTPAFTAFLLKPLIDRTGYAPPRNMEHITAAVAVVKDLPYSGNGRLDLYYPRVPAAPRPVIMWIHGGGYIGGRKEAIQAYGMALANEGYVVANIEYAVAPGRKYPGPVVQANAALQYLQAHVAEYGGAGIAKAPP